MRTKFVVDLRLGRFHAGLYWYQQHGLLSQNRLGPEPAQFLAQLEEYRALAHYWRCTNCSRIASTKEVA